MVKIYVQQPIVPHYRVPFFDLLRKHWGSFFVVHCGDIGADGLTRTVDACRSYSKVYRNWYLMRGQFLWQKGLLQSVLDADILVANFNIRHLSTWAILVLRYLHGKPTLLWGHAKGRSRYSGLFRRIMVSFSSGFIAYTKSEKKQIEILYPSVQRWFLGNSCVWKADCATEILPIEEIEDILYVGRFTKDKRPGLLFEAFCRGVDSGALPQSIRLVMIGDGAEREKILEAIDDRGMHERVLLPGAITDADALCAYYRRAFCAVSPGYAGLSVIQSFANGVVLVLPQGEKHSPEVEACEAGINSFYFKNKDPDDLIRVICTVYADRQVLVAKRPMIAERIAKYYSYESMAENFIKAIDDISMR